MLTDELEGNKNADARFGTAGKIFEFAHCLTQLKVWAYAVDEAAKNVWGTIPEGGIVLKSQFPTCKVELPATVTFEGIPADLALPAKKAADDGAIGYPLALPVAASFDEADAAACGIRGRQGLRCGAEIHFDSDYAPSHDLSMGGSRRPNRGDSLGLSCDRDGPITENVSFSVRRKRSGGGECGGRKPETKKVENTS